MNVIKTDIGHSLKNSLRRGLRAITLSVLIFQHIWGYVARMISTPLVSAYVLLSRAWIQVMFIGHVSCISESECQSETSIRSHKQEINTVPNQRGGFQFILALLIVTSKLYYFHVIITSMSKNVIVSVSNNNNTTMQFWYSRADAFGPSMHSGVNEHTKVSEI